MFVHDSSFSVSICDINYLSRREKASGGQAKASLLQGLRVKTDVQIHRAADARHRALRYLKETGAPLVYCAISCCIGRPDITLAFFNERNEQLAESVETFGPQEAANLLRLREPRYAELCRNGLFSRLR